MNILIVGGSSGIGLDYLKNHCSTYQNVWVIGRRPSMEVDDVNMNFSYQSLDIENANEIGEFVDTVPDSFDKILFSAGVRANNPLMVFDQEKWKRDIQINLVSVGLLLGGLYRKRKINPDSDLVILSSINGTVRGSKGCIGYASAKAGILGFVKVFANEAGKKGVKINCISPGMVETPLVDDLNHISPSQLELDKKRYPLKNRYALPSDISGLLRFLLEDNDYITGQNIVIDGGHTIAG